MTNTGNNVEGRAQNKPTRPRLKWYWKLAAFLFFGFTIFYMLMPALNSLVLKAFDVTSFQQDPIRALVGLEARLRQPVFW